MNEHIFSVFDNLMLSFFLVFGLSFFDSDLFTFTINELFEEISRGVRDESLNDEIIFIS